MLNGIRNNGMFTTVPEDIEFVLDVDVAPFFVGATDDEIAMLQSEIFGE